MSTESTETPAAPKRSKYQKFEAVEIHRSEIKNAPYNPRQIKETNARRLKAGIKKHGLVGSITWNKQTGNIVGGHRRMDALDELEGTDDYLLTVDVIDVPLAKELAINLLLNNRKAQGEDNLVMLQGVLEMMQEEGADFEDAGYTRVDIQQYFPDMFAVGEVAEQIAAEKPDIEFFQQVKADSKEVDPMFRASMAGESGVQYDDVDTDDGEPDSDAPRQQSAEPVPAGSPAGGSAPAPASEAEPGKDWKHSKDYFKEHRARTVDNNRNFKNETDIILTMTFQTNEQLSAFLTSFGMNHDKRNFDVYEIEEAFGVVLPRQDSI